MSNLDPKDQVDNATELPHQDVLSTPLPLPILFDHQVSHTNLDNTAPDATNNDNVIVDDLNEEGVTDTVETGNHDSQGADGESYMLPPRSTRGVPPRRYDPVYEAKRSRYPIKKPDTGNLSQSALAFKAALDATKSPTTGEEPLTSAH